MKVQKEHMGKVYVGKWQQYNFKEPSSSSRPGMSADPSDRKAMRNVITRQ